MGLIEKIAYNVSNNIGVRTGKTKDEIEIINYGLFIIVHTSIAIIINIAIGIWLGILNELMIIFFVSSTLKRYSGGVHASSPNKCLIIGTITSILLVYLQKNLINIDIKNTILIISICSMLCYYIFYTKCPVGTKNKPLKNEKTRKILRKKLFRLVNIYYIIIIGYIIYILTRNSSDNVIHIIYCIQLGILLQAVSLTKVGEATVLNIDKLLTYKNYRGN